MLLRPDFPRPLAGGATLRRHLATAATYGARPRDGEATLTERDRPAAPALGTGRERRAGRATRPAARRALLRQRQHDRNLSPERRHAEGNRDHRRSEERRVGKEGRSGVSPWQYKKSRVECVD